ncbi:intermembrane lipid transfer protein Vps13D isoform X1 [Drosophila albomicans]|uniref:Intermembrane lipid transfer protein Vps13D isoform X1 n=2 Tax=Drosophila albomicans TaxID=7291 RepID=A0A9C6SWP0_DROAB|nr:intermembrane lipid transfer protein Vps13D isoform X1 [Drosophila albomicans]XP_051860656.1 intermembrane lipid transfer protein Vps13D isoform X1 [Drosophila albomicans]
MLGDLITWVLNTYLGKYLENLNSAQLSVALLSGEVELENIPIRKDALRSVGLPIEVSSGSIGKIKLQVPVRQFRTSPWCISVEGLFCVVCPKDFENWDEAKEKLMDLEYKQSVLDTAEANWRSEKGKQVESYYFSSYNNWLKYGTNMATNIIDNIELKINDVHFRYEDIVDVGNSKIAAGIRIGSLTAQTCDSNWTTGANKTINNDVNYKIVELKELSLYWDTLHDDIKCQKFTNQELLQHMNPTCQLRPHDFIIKPISATARWKREKSPQVIRSKEKPRVSCDLQVPEVIIVLSKTQHVQIQDKLAGIRQIKEISQYRLKRPAFSILENPRAWWKYVLICHGRELKKKDEKYLTLKENLRYVRIYQAVILNPNENLSTEDKEFKSYIESDRAVAELIILRRICFEKTFTKGLAIKSYNATGKRMLFHWFPNWMGWYGTNNAASTEQDETLQHLEDDILVALEHSLQSQSNLKCDTVFGYFTIELLKGIVILQTEDAKSEKNACMEMQFNNLSSFLQLNPMFTSYVVGISLGEVYLLDKTNNDSKHCYLIKPQTERSTLTHQSDLRITTTSTNNQDPLFQLQYENDDQLQYRLLIKSKSLDLIYNPDALDWCLKFFTKSNNVRPIIENKYETGKENNFLNSWNQLLLGNEPNRKSWTFEIEVFAPRIIFLENYKINNSLMVLMDFGKFQLVKTDFQKKSTVFTTKTVDNYTTDSNGDEEETYLTPCSTPPGSEKSGSESPTIHENFFRDVMNKNSQLETVLQSKIYNTYTINFTNLQVLVCKYQERWETNLKSSSNFHLIDKFNITLTIKQRIVFTSDPEYPSFTLFGTCPMILIHGNEERIKHFLNIVYPITNSSRFRDKKIQKPESKLIADNYNVNGSHLVVQFAIGQLIIEMQSKEKSIAELQIIGARAGIITMGGKSTITMSVHGLLLVDAIQSFGPDFELLVASHRNVGMDSYSGSLKHSTACSPVSPSSPDPADYHRPTSPHIIKKAVQNIQSESTDYYEETELNALINIDIVIIAPNANNPNYVHTTKIAFNSLEIIANQETILELLNFAERIFNGQPIRKNMSREIPKETALALIEPEESLSHNNSEIIFDFFRLNVLILYTTKLDRYDVARKVGTITISEAKINMSMQSSLNVIGSLGGIQIIDITPQGIRHQRILSIGKDPESEYNRQSVLNKLSNEIYLNNSDEDKSEEIEALSFTTQWNNNTAISLQLRMASVSYTHNPRFLHDFNFCITSFKQSLREFLTSIGNKATDIAKEFVQQIKDVNAQTKPALSSKSNEENTRISLDVIINSPIIVLPVSNDSKEVFIANLGKLCCRNDINESLENMQTDVIVKYIIEVTNINLFSLNINEQNEDWAFALPIASRLYANKQNAFPILHDTAISLKLNLGYGDADVEERRIETLSVEGSMVETLKVTLYRKQYKNILDSIKNATNFSDGNENIKPKIHNANTTNSIDPSNDVQRLSTTVKFSVPVLEINLQNESHEPLVNVTFKDFFVKHRIRGNDEHVKVILNSVLMEDLKSDVSSPFRNMVTSLNLENSYRKNGHSSSSCPDLPSFCSKQKAISTSVPSNLCEYIKLKNNQKELKSKLCSSKDISDQKKHNLVIYRSHTRRLPQQTSETKVERQNSIEFNCLNLTICVDRWYTIFDFFGLIAEPEKPHHLIERKDIVPESIPNFCSTLNVSIRSLNFNLTRNEAALTKINVSNATFSIIQEEAFKAVEGCLGSISVYDLTKFGCIYKERFLTSGSEALNFVYKRKLTDLDPSNVINADAVLWINMSSVHYIHTKRFIVELHLFIKELLQLQTPVIRKLKRHNVDRDRGEQSSKIKLCIQAATPIIVLPACYNSNHVLIAYLGQFTLKNSFHFANDECIISKKGITPNPDEILDVMRIDLVNINFFSAERNVQKLETNYDKEIFINIANTIFIKGSPIFKESCYLNVQVERNLTTESTRVCPDISVKGTFSRLNATLNIQTYKLIRGLLANNMGENIDDVHSHTLSNNFSSMETFSALNLFTKTEDSVRVLTLLSISILLEDVSILLVPNSNTMPDFVLEPLACIHFIRSQLEIDMFSDGAQDIDLISSNILIVDERPEGKHNANVFRNVLQPSKKATPPKHSAQVEIHCRKRASLTKYTIMLNDMRVIGILDFLDHLKKFLEEDSLPVMPMNHRASQALQMDQASAQPIEASVTEYIINVTDSEIIFVEQYNRLDSNAIILKSTTVISYKPNNSCVPLSININHLEIFSCTLDAEDESALSIIDPFTLNIELRNNCLNIVVHKQLNIRLSYIDMKLFLRMISMIPNQTSTPPNVLSKSNSEFEKIAPLLAMGFEITNCWYAMELNNWKLNDAALWLSQQKRNTTQNPALELKTAVLDANCISMCVIDDCMDADVPLLEISLTKMLLKYKFQANGIEVDKLSSNNSAEGDLDTEVTLNYYNRRLSGWEPLAEIWQCAAKWKYKRLNFDKRKRFEIFVNSKQLLKINITSTLIELIHMVVKNWTSDFHSLDNVKNSNFRQRSPYVPFALQNLTGSALLFKPIYAQLGDLTGSELHQLEIIKNWITVEPNEIKTFDFSQKSKLRHIDSHLLNLHQILVQIHGWTLIGPISVDKVGIYFRSTILDSKYEKKTRIIFDISLMGSAQKLIKVMSPLKIINKLDHEVYLKKVLNRNQVDAMTAISTITPNDQQCVPLKFLDASLYISHVPSDGKRSTNNADAEDVGFSNDEITWKHCCNDGVHNLYTCYDINKSILYTLISISKEMYPYKDKTMPGHTITLLSPLMLKNMLCCDLIFNINGYSIGRINAFQSKNIYNVNVCEPFNLSITLDNFQVSGQLKIPTNLNGIVEPKLKLIDAKKRELHLHISIHGTKGKGIEIYISAPIWIINKTGLPLIFKQEGATNIGAGQFEEHETARQVSPLMFSFSDQEGSPSLEVRLGNSFGTNNQWCKSFSLIKHITHRELRTEGGPGCYTIGISVRRGRGLYSSTTFVTMAPRFHLYNKSGHPLQFAQKCNVVQNEYAKSSHIISAPIDCNFQFHWANWDREPLICVRIADVECCCWSKGIPISDEQSLYINVRNEWCEMFFLRLEIISRDATLILLFTDARSLPPPIRIDNFSEVVVNFSQKGSRPVWSTPVRPQSSLSYVMDDPLGSQILLLEAPGGNINEFPVELANITKSLTYSNFIYIAFHNTFDQFKRDGDKPDDKYQQLVLGVYDKRVVIMEKNSGDRSQLWLMNSNGQLEHEGSTPPVQSNEGSAVRMVLDLEKPPNPTEFTPLVVRTPNKQRVTTQTWRFENGRLMCHANMCVQSPNGKSGLRPGAQAVLGRIKHSSKTSDSIPIQQHLVAQKLRPGSGQLEISSKMDGPIRTVQICDIKLKPNEIILAPDLLWTHASFNNRQIMDKTKPQAVLEFQVNVELPKGIGISIITLKPCEEIVYISLDNIIAEIRDSSLEKSLDLNIAYIQVDNQLMDAASQVTLHSVIPAADDVQKNALLLKVKMLPSPNKHALIFQYLTLDVKPCIMCLEEKLILKIAAFLGYGRESKQNTFLPSDYEDFVKKSLENDMRRYYFESFRIEPSQVRLSAFTSSKLPEELQATKRALGLTLIKFEDASIDLDYFSDKYHFETIDIYLRAIKKHYINQIKWHAASILGSVDFLGNPLGFANDLSEGVSGLIFEGSVKSLVKNVTHGISNSTAKLTETLSDSLGKVVLDDHDNETRQRILELQSNTSGGHLAAGIKGFGFGLLGGVTSIVRHTYDGAAADGVPGFLSGLGKGLVGTVTKPIIGMLDLASETASAVRETSRDTHRNSPNRKRLPRCITGAPGGLLPSYSSRQSKGQQYLYLINRKNFAEKIIFYEPNIWSDKEARLRLLVSTEYVRHFSLCEENPTVMFECHLSEILSCHHVTTNTATTSTASKTISSYYIEISINLPKITRPRIRCRNEECAEAVSRCINYAKSVFDEREMSLTKY